MSTLEEDLNALLRTPGGTLAPRIAALTQGAIDRAAPDEAVPLPGSFRRYAHSGMRSSVTVDRIHARYEGGRARELYLLSVVAVAEHADVSYDLAGSLEGLLRAHPWLQERPGR